MHGAKNPEFFGQTAISVLFSWGAILKTFNFMFASLAIGAATFLYVRFVWDGGKNYEDQNYAGQAKKVAAGFAIVGLIFQPVFFGLGMAFNNAEAFSKLSFAAAIVSVVFAFIASHQIYSIIRLKNANFIKLGYWVLIIGFTSFVASEHFGFVNSNEKNVLVMAHNFHEIEAKLASANAAPEPVDAAKIFETRCSSCHQFDVQGDQAPAYKNAVPKYNGDVDALASFIQNPSPRGNIKPDGSKYPMMANQGLNKREARAMAEWILSELDNY
jgi:cytochrome c551/c552